VHLGGARLAQHPDQGTLGVAAHDRVVDDDQPLAPDDLLEGVELQPDAELPDGLAGLDEGAADVGVLHQARAVRDAAGLGVADGGRGAGLRGRYHQVGLGRGLGGEPAAHLDPGEVDAAPGDVGVGAGEVDVLEDAAARLCFREARGTEPVLVDGDQLARLDLTDDGGADDVEGGGLGGHDPAALQAAEDQRADALRVAGGVEGVLVHEDEAVRPPHERQHLRRGLLDGQGGAGGLVGLPGEEGGDQVRVVGHGGGGAFALALALAGELGGQGGELGGVDEIAVVAEGDRAVAGGAEGGLGVLPGRGAGGGVAGVAHGEVAGEGGERGLVEDLGDQAHVLEDEDLRTVAHRDAGGFLAAVLEGVEPEVGELGDLLARGPDSEDSAGVLRALLSGAGSGRSEVVAE
jgi:hypothetical protein